MRSARPLHRQPLPRRGLQTALRLLTCALAAPLISHAGWVTPDGKPLPDRPEMRSNGNLGAMLVLSNDGEAFRRAWARPTPPQLKSTDKVRRGEKLTANVLYHGCQANAQGACDLTVRFNMVTPEGRVTPGGTGPLGDRPSPDGQVQLGHASLATTFDHTDAIGRYQVHAVITDRVARRQVALTASIDLIP